MAKYRTNMRRLPAEFFGVRDAFRECRLILLYDFARQTYTALRGNAVVREFADLGAARAWLKATHDATEVAEAGLSNRDAKREAILRTAEERGLCVEQRPSGAWRIWGRGVDLLTSDLASVAKWELR